jgi:predicted kinase
VLFCGLPGSGKTTYACERAEQLAAVRLSSDDWLRRLDIDLYDVAARNNVEALQWDLAQWLVAHGVNVVIEWGVWTRAERDRIRLRCRELGVPVELRYLDVPVEELWQRVSARNDQPGNVYITREDLMHWSTLFEAPTPDELSQFDPPS